MKKRKKEINTSILPSKEIYGNLMKNLVGDIWGRKPIKANQCNTRKVFVKQNFVDICKISVFNMIIAKNN